MAKLEEFKLLKDREKGEKYNFKQEGKNFESTVKSRSIDEKGALIVVEEVKEIG